MSIIESLELNLIIKDAMQYSSFSLSKEMMEEELPSFDPLIIKRNLNYIKEALSILNQYETMPFYGIKDLSDTFEKANKGSLLSAQELNDIKYFIQGIQGIKKYQENLNDVEHTNLDDLLNTLIVHDKVLKSLESCIDDYGSVLDSASSELKDIRRGLRGIDAEITQVAQKFIQANRDSIVDGIVAYRSNRAVVLVKASDKNQFGGLVYGDSSSGQASYIEPESLVKANNKKQELLLREKEEVDRILRKLSNEVHLIAEECLANLNTTTILDVIFAKANWGKRHDATCPTLTNEKALVIEKARHPLIDEKLVVANSYHVIDPIHMLLITGPNTGGKTVSLKIIGLFVLMTYSGYPLPCENASIPLFDRVFEDIGDDQSVVSSLSSFSAHVKKQAEICEYATSDSLVLLDELGSGTDPKEGESIGIALLNMLREKECMTIVTTHFSRMKAYGKRHADILLASVEFDMENLMPTYRYIEGQTGSSNAIDVAEKYGLPKELVKYARFLKEQSKTDEEKLIERLELQLQEISEKEELLNSKIESFEKDRAKLDKEIKQFQKEKDDWKYNLETEANSYIESVKEEADEILSELRNKNADLKYHELIDKKKLLNDLVSETMEEEFEDEDYTFQVGDAVELRSSNQVCEIIRIKKKDITVRLNGREMHVKSDQIRPSAHVIPKMKHENNTSIHFKDRNMYSSVSLECNLIGMSVSDAMVKLGDYLSEIKLHGLKQCRIIHGDGTGKLRKAVHQYLDKNKEVEEYRIGMPQEGGTGATVVKLK